MMNKNKKSLKRIVVILILFSIGLIVSFITIDKLLYGKHGQKLALKNGIQKLQERELCFQYFISQSKNQLQSIRESKNFNLYLKNQKSEIQDLFFTITNSNTNFMQLRYIDKNGLEKIRIDRQKEGAIPFIVEKEKLQNKSDRYYFFTSKEKKLEEVWFSAFDLNIENKQVEIPYKSTLRAILPLSNNGKFDGILIINYFMDNFIKKLFNTPLYDMILVNKKGEVLKHYDDKKSWNHYNKNTNYTLENEFKEITKEILNKDFFSNDALVSKKFDLPIRNELILILQLKEKYLQDENMNLYSKYLLESFIILLLSIILSFLLSSTIQKLYGKYFKVKEFNETLKKQKTEFKTIFKHSKDGLVILDLDFNFVNFNKAYMNMVGYSKKELLHRSCLDLTPKEDIEKTKETLQKVIEVGYLENFEKPCIAKDDKIIILSMSLSLMPDKKRILISVKDISQMKFMENKSRLASMGEMLENIAHQWRQPLSVISTSASGIEAKINYEKEIKKEDLLECTKIVTTQTEYLSNTINEFKNFLRDREEIKTISIVSTIKKALNLTNATFIDYNIMKVLTLDDDIQIEGYENEMAQAFMNIFNNSKEALLETLPKKDKFLFVETTLIKNGLKVIIQDNAKGIKKENLERIFEPYFTTKHQSVGTGLGLSMTHEVLTKKHNATISVSNSNYKYKEQEYTGARFKIIFTKK